MGNFIKTQNTFSYGEVAPDFYAMNNINGVSKLENMDVLQSGGLKRRPGLKRIHSVPATSVLVPFVIDENEKYLLVIYEQVIDIYSNDEKISSVTTPWHTADLPKIQYAQRFNTIFFVHPDYKPRLLTKTVSGFKITQFNFYANSDLSLNVPFMRFDDMENISITITSSGIDNNHATFTTNADFWSDSWIGERLLVNNKQWIVESVQDERVAIVYTNGDFSFPGTAIYDWYVAAFGNMRGWPMTISFHQNRLVFGGIKAAPNHIWMSKTGDYYNFDVGSGLDDEAIYLTLLSAQHHQICNIVSSDSLQIFTSLGEWAISNSPLTPSNVNIKQHTSVGCITTRYLPTQQIEGRTVFISATGKDLREMDLDTLNDKYNTIDLCAFSKHLMNDPVSVSYNQKTHKLHIVMSDGEMAVLNKYANDDIAAWAKYTTDGMFKYVATIDNATYVVVSRENTGYLEKFDDTCLNDSNEYGFSYKVSAFPIIVNGHTPKKLRARKISLRVRDTKTLFVNEYRMEIPNYVYEEGAAGYNGDLFINLLGTTSETMQPLWTVSSSEQLPATILSVTIDGWYSI